MDGGIMSTVKSKKLQVGTDATASNNFTIYQPDTPDGTLRIGVGNADSPTEVAGFNATGLTGNGSQLTNLPGGGKILQVVSVLKTDVFSTTSTSLVDVTGLTLDITPSSASSTILVSAYVNGVSGDNAVVQLQRDGTVIGAGDAASSRTRSFGGGFYTPGGLTHAAYSITFLDSPATTSTLTYKIQAGSPGGAVVFYLGRNLSDTDNGQHCRTPQCITLMEVAA